MNKHVVTVKEFREHKNRVILAFFAMLLVLISWLGVCDYLAYAYLAESLLNALSSYGLSRALNGIISVLQSSTLSVGIASVSVGQLLDPINDIIERFSGLITLSIAAIILQKVLLSIVSSVFFKVILTVSGFSLLASLIIKEPPYIQFVCRSFLLLVFFRLALSFMVLLSSTVDNAFLATQINDNYQNINTETKKLDTLKDEIIQQNDDQNKLKNSLIESRKNQKILVENLSSLMNNKHKLEQAINALHREIELYENKLSTFERYNFFREDVSLDAFAQDLDILEQQLEKKEESIVETQESLEEIDEKISFYENTISGKTEGLVSGFRKLTVFLKNNNIAKVNDKLVEVKQKLDFIVNNLLDLMTLYIMKTILLPLLYMYLLTKSFKLIWEIELYGFLKN